MKYKEGRVDRAQGCVILVSSASLYISLVGKRES